MKHCHRTLSIVACCALFFISSSGLAWGQEEEEEVAETPTQDELVSFPRRVENESGVVVIHAPQIDTWKDFAAIEARVAVEVTPAGEDEVVAGL